MGLLMILFKFRVPRKVMPATMCRKPHFNIANLLLLCFSVFFTVISNAQCPQNIGFESGTFINWECFAGNIDGFGYINVASTAPIADRHVIIANSVPQLKDYYGGFPINCPNGSKYSIRLGNSNTGSQAERVSYTFTIPPSQTDFSIIYNYAVVFQNPNHAAIQQPKFTAKVFDVTANRYVDCGSFQFVASGNLPGFQVSPVKADVFYKPWSPITIKLLGYAGKTIRLEFTNNDCTPGGHFGYAYIDVNENCTSPISGNTYCAGTTDSLTLVAPFGFQQYNWYSSDFSSLLGTSNTLTLSPPPPPNTTFALEIIPYPGLGCLDTLRTTIQYSDTLFNFHTLDTLATCSSSGVDLTLPYVTAGSSGGLSYSYFTDYSQQNYLPTPTFINTPGTYFIKGTNSEGCNAIKPINIILKTPPTLIIKNPPLACAPQKVDLTDPTYKLGSDAGLTYTYWKDTLATIPIVNPTMIDASGTYFIKGTNPTLGCYEIKPITVIISITPTLVVYNQSDCGKVDITKPTVVIATAGTILSYWKNNAATIPFPIPESITASGTYFIKASNVDGCNQIKPIDVTVKLVPTFAVINPLPVAYPLTVNLSSLIAPMPNTIFSYWHDSTTTKPLINYKGVDTTGTYFIKSQNTDGCIDIHPVKVIVNEPVIAPPNAISPNGDGINDTWEIPLLKRYPYCTVQVFNRYGQMVFNAMGYQKPWDATMNGKILPTGTYYYIINRGIPYPPISGNISVVY